MTERKTTSLKSELIGLEKQYWQALKDRDVDAALALTDDPCVVTGAQGVGVIDRKSFTAMMEGATYTLDDFKFKEDAEVRMLTDDVAVLAYSVHETLIVDGKEITLDCVDSSTWVRRDGSWVCALHSEALKGDPFGRDRRNVS
jgi:hypothetical protein